jgi:hypothetical protein
VASEVFGGGGRSDRSYKVFGLVNLGVLWAVALAVAFDGRPDPPDASIPVLLGVGVLVFLAWGWALPWLASTWVLEVDPDMIRWRGGWRRRYRIIQRAEVVETKHVSIDRWGHMQLRFYDAAGERVGLVPLFHFSGLRVVAALKRDGWPVPETGEFRDAAQWP